MPDTAPSGQRLPSLDGFRALSILLVLGEHASMSIGYPRSAEMLKPLFSGYLGVRIFFVLSGFLISRLLLVEQRATGRVSLSRFYARRALRIVPAYAAYTAVLVLLQWWTPLHLSACDYLTTATFTKDLGCGRWLDGHFWSLAIEQQFYLVWPALIAFAPPRWRLRAVWAAVALAPVARLLCFRFGWYNWEVFSPFVNVDALMLGSALAIAEAADPARTRRFFERNPIAWRAFATAVVLANVFRDWVAPGGVLGVALIDTFAAVAVAYLVGSFVTVRRGAAYTVLNAPAIAYLGAISYSIYIWQQPFFDAYNDFHAVPAVITFPLNLAAAFAVATVSYHALERPLLAWRRRLHAADRPATAATRIG